MLDMNSNDYISTDELLELLDSIERGEISPSKIPSNKCSDFVDKFKIKKGIDRIPNFVIYYTYRVLYEGSMGKTEFFRQFSKLFDRVRTGRQRSYLLDSYSFDLTREGLLRAKYYDKEEKDKKKSKKVSKPNS